MTTSNEHNNAPAVLEQELSALLTTSLPYMTPVGRARLGQDIAQLYSSVSAPAVPQGRTELEIVEQTEELAAYLMHWRFGQEPESPSVKFRDTENVKAQKCWAAACHIQEMITATDVENAVAEVDDAPAPAPAQYKDSTPQLSVGESSFEYWFESYNPANKGDKQRSRDAYAAGMGDPLVAAAPAQGEPFGYFRAEPFGWTDCAEDDEGAIALYERPQEVGLTDEALDNLIEDLSEWSRHVVEDTAHQTLEAHVREVLAKNPIIAALRAKGGKL